MQVVSTPFPFLNNVLIYFGEKMVILDSTHDFDSGLAVEISIFRYSRVPVCGHKPNKLHYPSSVVQFPQIFRLYESLGNIFVFVLR